MIVTLRLVIHKGISLPKYYYTDILTMVIILSGPRFMLTHDLWHHLSWHTPTPMPQLIGHLPFPNKDEVYKRMAILLIRFSRIYPYVVIL